MKKLTRFILGSTLSALSAYAFATGTVVVESQNHAQQTEIANLSRLSQLVTHPALAQETWWAGAVIAAPQGLDKVQKSQQAVLSRLAACKTEASPKEAIVLQSAIDQLKNIRVVDRLFTPLDPDAVRSLNGADVALQGPYRLYTRSEPSTVQIMGAVSRPGPVMWQPATTVSRYLAFQDFLSGANRSDVTIIHPDGHTTVAPIAYWNNLHREAEPGSILWVGFSSCAENSAGGPLQNDIISLLTRRVAD